MSRNRTWLIAALLAGSGFCALVYQVAWLREFRLIFGASTAASAAVLAIFIGGLGVGGFLLGPRADRQDQPLRFYATLEAIVAISAALTPLLFFVVRALYLFSGGSTSLGAFVATAGRLILSALVLAVPTVAMGGTLPAAARAATRDTDTRRQDVAALYALNTLGAVVGCLVATFWMLEAFGTHATIWIAAACNLLVAARWFVRLPPELCRGEAGRYECSAPGTRHGGTQHPAPHPQHPATPAPSTPAPQHPGTPSHPAWFLLSASGAVGFAFFLMELVWYRMLSPLLGGSVFTFGLVLAIALAGIGLGGLLYALVAGDKPASMSGFATICLLEGAAVAATFASGDRLAVLAMALQPLEVAGFPAHIAGWTIVTALIVLPPALIAGYQFPQLIALFGQGRSRVGEQSRARLRGQHRWRHRRFARRGLWLAAVAVRTRCVATDGRPSARARRSGRRQRGQRHTHALDSSARDPIGRSSSRPSCWSGRQGRPRCGGRAASVPAGPHAMCSPRRTSCEDGPTFSDEASSGQPTVWKAASRSRSIPTGYAFMINGKADGSARADAGTQVMSGLLAALADPAATRAMVIGLGTGSTAGWLGAIPAMNRVDVVELEPRVIEVARACAPVNRDVLNNPKVHIIIGDARETLLTSRDRYDIIASEPSNPYRAGVASLFTLEYYQAAAERLSDDGVFAQWVQGYEIDSQTFSTVYATLAKVFPQIETWRTSRNNDLVLDRVEAPAHLQRSSDQRTAGAGAVPDGHGQRVACRLMSTACWRTSSRTTCWLVRSPAQPAS